eukprot:jgi/Hompol1/2532/HPOL_006041-RA
MTEEQEKDWTCAEAVDFWMRFKRLPQELKDNIYEMAGDLTEYLHGRFIQPVTQQQYQCIMVNCYLTDNIAKVQTIPLSHPTWELLGVRSDAMLDAIQNRYQAVKLSRHETLLRVTQAPEDTGLFYKFIDMLQSDLAIHPVLRGCALTLTHALLRVYEAAGILPVQGAAASTDAAGQPSAETARLTNADVGRVLLQIASALGLNGLVSRLIACGAQTSSEALFLAALHGHIAIVDKFITMSSASVSGIDGAVQGGHIPIIDAVYKAMPGLIPSPSAIEFALAQNHLHTVWYLIEDVSLWREETFSRLSQYCASHGHLDLLQFAFENHIGRFDEWDVLENAATGGHLHIAEWLLSTGYEVPAGTTIIEDVARNGHTFFADFLVDKLNRATPEPNMMDNVSYYGCLEGAQWLLDRLGPNVFSHKALEKAIQENYDFMIEFLVDKAHVEILEEDCKESARQGSLIVVKTLYPRFPQANWHGIEYEYLADSVVLEWLDTQDKSSESQGDFWIEEQMLASH